MPGDGRLRLPFCRKINGKRSSRSAGAPFPFRAPDKRSPEAFPVRAKGSCLPLNQSLRALRIWGRSCKAGQLQKNMRGGKIRRRELSSPSAQMQVSKVGRSQTVCTVRAKGSRLPLIKTLQALIISFAGFFSLALCAAGKSEGESSAPLPRSGRKLRSGADLAPMQQPMV